MDRLPHVSSEYGDLFRIGTNKDSIWGLSEGAHVIDVDAEIISYAVLDILAKPVSQSHSLCGLDASTNMR